MSKSPSPNKGNMCNDCGKSFSSKPALYTHTTTKHQICCFCEQQNNNFDETKILDHIKDYHPEILIEDFKGYKDSKKKIKKDKEKNSKKTYKKQKKIECHMIQCFSQQQDLHESYKQRIEKTLKIMDNKVLPQIAVLVYKYLNVESQGESSEDTNNNEDLLDEQIDFNNFYLPDFFKSKLETIFQDRNTQTKLEIKSQLKALLEQIKINE